MRSRIEQRSFEETSGVPTRLRGWQISDIEYAAGLHKAHRLIAWAVSVGGSSMTAFPLDRVRLPTVTFDPRTSRYRRLLPPKAKRAQVVAFPRSTPDIAA
jgi:hypothetical protein